MLGTVREVSPGVFAFRTMSADGAVRGFLRVGATGLPSEPQLGWMRWAVTQADQVKRLAVAFVRNEVLNEPDRYGLLEEEGRPAEWAAPYFGMSEAEYFDDFRLESLEVDEGAPDFIRVTYAAELDPEHGVPVLFQKGKPVEAFA